MYASDLDTKYLSTGRSRGWGVRDVLKVTGGAIGSVLAKAARRSMERSAAMALTSMDEYLLRDIGVTRADVERTLLGGHPLTRTQR
jgi:hypothetical protein